jgi:mRNA interferase MazF
MKESDIILTSLIQTDGQIKNRPVLLLRMMPKYQDFLACGISSQLQQYVSNFDEIVSPSDADFTASGLVNTSVIRLSFLAIIPQRKIIGSIGSISAQRHQKLLQNLSDYLTRKLKIP